MPRGRPEWIPTEESIEQVESYAALGLTKEQIAHCLGISYQTLNEKTKEYSDFSDAIKRGSSKGIAMVANELTKNVKLGNVTAQIFYLKARANWSDKGDEKPLGENVVQDEIKSIQKDLSPNV